MDDSGWAQMSHEQKITAYIRQCQSAKKTNLKFLENRIQQKDNLRQLEYALGLTKHSSYLRASSCVGREKLLSIQDKELRRHFSKSKQGRKGFWHVTIIDTKWLTLDRSLEIDFITIKDRIKRSLRRIHPTLSFIGHIEVTPVANYPRRGIGRCVTPHAHLIVWCSSENSTEVSSRLQACRYGGVFRKNGIFVQDIPTRDDLRVTAAYGAKMHNSQKVLKLKGSVEDDNFRFLLETHNDMRPDLMVRMLRLHSLFSFKDSMISARKGNSIRTSILRQLKELHLSHSRFRFRDGYPFCKTRKAWEPHFSKRFPNDHPPLFRVSHQEYNFSLGIKKTPYWVEQTKIKTLNDRVQEKTGKAALNLHRESPCGPDQ